jgi:eukaryotic-like serine/threonine-protein kinase
MKLDPKGSAGDSGAENPRPDREGDHVCSICNTPLASDNAGEFCAVCMLRSAVRSGIDSPGELGLLDSRTERAFEHYELALNEDGSAVELGRGAMGVTYKAFDTELRCPVALKEIGERYLGDDVALRRFLREARAAASLRHPNVASVFHLGRTGRSYFYAMEFVEGETLERLIKRSGSLEIRLALDIASQVASGLTAIDRQRLIHRDIKPANIMISFDERGAATVKIIDLGLAKSLNDSRSESAISMPGSFAGTPEFASPEQFLGSGVDIRSDLYSLGVTLWNMVTGQVPFRGTPGEVMYQHRRRSPPTEQLKSIPQPVVVLLELLLEKDPGRRLQTPAELSEAVETVKGAILAGRRVMKTVRVSVLAPGDVQKERNLADRLMHSIAAEFNIPVSAAEITFRRLVEADLVLQTSDPDESSAEIGNFVICLSFSQDEKTGYATGGDQQLSAAPFDLVICIVWARLNPLANSILAVPTRGATEPEISLEITSTQTYVESDFGDSGMLIYRNCNNPILPLEPKEERDEFGRRWDAVQEFFAAWESKKTGELSASVTDYQSLQDFEEVFRKDFRRYLASRLSRDGERVVSRPKVRRWQSSPFRGLNLFGFEHSPIFYGRTKSIGEVLEAMEAQVRVGRPFVIVVGPSGSGKSSLIQAGVLPLLTQPGTIEGIGLWRRAVTRPGAGGSGGDCFDALAAALLERTGLPALQDPESTNGTRDLARELRDHADSVALRVRDALDHAGREWKFEHRFQLEQQERQLRASGRQQEADLVRKRAERIDLPKTRLALVVDQLEELFTTGFSAQIRQDYVAAITDLARSGRVYVLATLRSDFYFWYQQFPELIELTKPSGKVDLRPPGSHEIGEIIRLPAEAAGLSFEAESGSGHRLDEALRDVASATPESLPLLEHVLSLLYDEQARRGDQILRWSDYRELGELKGALAQHAERVFATLRPDEQDAFPLVMRYLVTLGQGEEEVPNRRTVPYLDFTASNKTNESTKLGAIGFIDQFIQSRLLVADTDPHGEITVSVAHEALLREWQRVREWLSENREFLRMRDRLDASLKLWLSRGKQKDDLLRPGLALAEGEKLAVDFESSLSEQQAGYIRASIVERARLRSAQDRARYRVMGGITAALIVAVGFGIVSFRQYRRAERAHVAASEAASRATLARNEAEKLINFMTLDLRDKLKPIGRLDLLAEVSRRVRSYYEAFAGDDDSPEILRRRATALVNQGDVQIDQGALADSLKSYGDALVIRKKLVNMDAGNSNFQLDLSVSYEKAGNVAELQGDLNEALKDYQEVLRIRQSLAKQSPSNREWQRDLSTTFGKLGFIQTALGNLVGALKSYHDALAIVERLAIQDPNNADLVRDRWLVHFRIGEVLSSQGDLTEALNSYRAALSIRQASADRARDDAVGSREIALSLEKVSEVLTIQGDLSGALKSYREAFDIRNQLTQRDPSNAAWQQDLAVSYEDVGSILSAQGNLSGALQQYQECLLIREALADRDKTNADSQRDLLTGYGEIGDMLLRIGDLDGAFKNYQNSLDIAQKLTRQDPRNTHWQRDLSIVYESMGNVLKEQSHLDHALEMYRDSLMVRQTLVVRDKTNATWQSDVAINYREIGDVLMAQNDRSGALQNYHSSLSITERIAKQDQTDTGQQSALAVIDEKLGEALAAAGNEGEALRTFDLSLAIAQRLVRMSPENAEWESTFALCCLQIANTLPPTDDAARRTVQEMLRNARQALMDLKQRSALGAKDKVRLETVQAVLNGR